MRLVATVAVLIAAAAFAQAPAKIGYQGLLLKADGTPETGAQQITFSVFAGATGGTALWTETQTVALAQGYYAVYLGDVTALPSNLLDGTERFLEIATGGVAMTPRMRVNSVPYALNAGTARDLNGGAVNASQVQVNGATVIDSTGALAGTASYQGAAGISVSGRTISMPSTCAAGEILRWVGAPTSAWECAPFTPPSSDGGVVAYTADPDGGLQLTGSDFTAFSLLRSCSAGQLLKWNGNGWGCANDTDTDTQYTVQGNMGLALVSNGFGLMTCPNTQVLKSNGTTWACQPDTDTTTFSVTNGGGVTGSYAGGVLTLGSDTSIQRRSVGAPLTCPGGFLRTVTADGTSTCVAYAGSGSADTVARSDHAHSGSYLPVGTTLTCTSGNQVTGLDSAGNVICGADAVGDANVGNEVTNATNTTLTRSGAGTPANPYTLALNTANANVWNGAQTFDTGASVSDGQMLDMRGVSTIRFNSTTTTATPMISMFTGGTSNGTRFVVNHSASYPEWGMSYDDNSDSFRFGSSLAGTPALHVDLGGARVGIGTSTYAGAEKLNVSGAANVTGAITAQSFAHASPQTYYHFVPAAGMTQVFGDDPTSLWNGHGFWVTAVAGGSVNNQYVAPLDLPNGATVTSVTCYVWDNSATVDIAGTAYIVVATKSSDGSVASLSANLATSGQSATKRAVSSTGTVTLNKAANYYSFYAQFAPTGVDSFNVRFYGCELTYTMTGVGR